MNNKLLFIAIAVVLCISIVYGTTYMGALDFVSNKFDKITEAFERVTGLEGILSDRTMSFVDVDVNGALGSTPKNGEVYDNAKYIRDNLIPQYNSDSVFNSLAHLDVKASPKLWDLSLNCRIRENGRFNYFYCSFVDALRMDFIITFDSVYWKEHTYHIYYGKADFPSNVVDAYGNSINSINYVYCLVEESGLAGLFTTFNDAQTFVSKRLSQHWDMLIDKQYRTLYDTHIMGEPIASIDYGMLKVVKEQENGKFLSSNFEYFIKE